MTWRAPNTRSLPKRAPVTLQAFHQPIPAHGRNTTMSAGKSDREKAANLRAIANLVRDQASEEDQKPA
jgi:hypothetical protein